MVHERGAHGKGILRGLSSKINLIFVVRQPRSVPDLNERQPVGVKFDDRAARTHSRMLQKKKRMIIIIAVDRDTYARAHRTHAHKAARRDTEAVQCNRD